MDVEYSENIQDPWNQWEMSQPPNCTVMVPTTPEIITGVKDIKNALSAALLTFKHLDILNQEAAILSRYLYRFKRIFRHEKGLQQLVKVNQALHRYLNLDVNQTISNLTSVFPSRIISEEKFCYLPTRQMLKFVMLRLLALSKIFVRIINLSKDAGRYLYAKWCLGWSKTYTVTSIAVTSRILACVKYFLLNVIECYNSLRINMSILKETIEYLPNYNFPKKLENFIGDVDLKPPARKAEIDRIFDIIDLTAGSGDDDGDVIITNEIFLKNIGFGDDNDDDVIVEKHKYVKKCKRRIDDGVSIIYENKKNPVKCQSGMTAASIHEDLGKVISHRDKFLKKSHKKNRRLYKS